MDKKSKEIKDIENQIEEALWASELHDEIEKALYLSTEEPAYTEQQRVLAYCLMRQGNILRQIGKSQEAIALSERELIAARALKDEIMLARSLMSNGTNRIITGDARKGLELMEEARELFEGGESYDHQQGLGWYWILQADLANAGIIEREPAKVLEITGRALAILKPIENWAGVTRAYAAKVEAYERMGNEEEAEGVRKEQQYYKSKNEPEENAG